MSRPLVRALTSPYQPLFINSPKSQSRTAAACGGCSMIFPNYNGRRRPVLLLAINVKLEGSCNNIYDIYNSHRESRGGGGNIIRNAAVLAAATTMVVMMMSAVNVNAEPDDTTLSNIPQMLSGSDCNKKARIQRPKSRKAESCTIKCVGTCIRGGGGSPGEGPLNVRRPLVVFKQGFRTRQYCLVECSDICNLIGDGDDGP